MPKYFDGRAYAQTKEEVLKKRVQSLSSRGIIPFLVSIIVGDNFGSILYQNLKKKAAERVGAQLDIISLSSSLGLRGVQEEIEKFNFNQTVHGIMIQLPLPENFSKKDRDDLINTIKREKDVDGLRDDSQFDTPVVKAVVDAIPVKDFSLQVAVIGAHGFEGKKIVSKLKRMGFEKIIELGNPDEDLDELLPDADVIISATGKPDLVKPEMVKNGAVLIDVGSPKGDIAKDCYGKASFISPVPGGIGPATIVNLIENLVTASEGVN